MGGVGRWDRSVLKKMKPGERAKVEAMLHAGDMSGERIAKKMGWPKSTWVSAVKKNPIPGGVLDPKGKLAKHEGEWVDDLGQLQPWVGFDKKTKLPIRSVEAKPKPTTPAKVLGFIKREPEPAKVREDIEPPTQAPGPEPESEPEPTPDEPKEAKSKERGQLEKMRRLVNSLLPLREHVELLVAHARNFQEEPAASMKALDALASIRGIEGALKDPEADKGAGSLFRLPKGSVPGFAPVGTVPLTGEGVRQDLSALANVEADDDATDDSPNPGEGDAGPEEQADEGTDEDVE